MRSRPVESEEHGCASGERLVVARGRPFVDRGSDVLDEPAFAPGPAEQRLDRSAVQGLHAYAALGSRACSRARRSTSSSRAATPAGTRVRQSLLPALIISRISCPATSLC